MKEIILTSDVNIGSALFTIMSRGEPLLCFSGVSHLSGIENAQRLHRKQTRSTGTYRPQEAGAWISCRVGRRAEDLGRADHRRRTAGLVPERKSLAVILGPPDTDGARRSGPWT